MKILVLGDIHGRLCWLDIIEKEQPDKIIFLGDYVSTHDEISADQQLANLEDILNYKEEHSDSVVLLRGNHDTQHLGYSWAECSGWDQKVYEKMFTIKDIFLEKTQWLYPLQIKNKFIIFSHAGISNTWYEYIKKKHPEVTCIADINNLEPSEDFGFISNSPWDYSGDSITQSCTWIRPRTLVTDMPKGIIQVVGHTPVNGVCVNLLDKIREKKTEGSRSWNEIKDIPDLWLCDALSDGSYLVIEDGEFVSKSLKNDY